MTPAQLYDAARKALAKDAEDKAAQAELAKYGAALTPAPAAGKREP